MHCTPRLGGMSTMRYIIAIVLLYTYNTNWIVRAYNNNRLEKQQTQIREQDWWEYRLENAWWA